MSTSVLEGGEGQPVVLLHGPGGWAGHWMHVLPELATTHRVVAPDLPGQGASYVEDGTVDAEHVTRWLGELIDATIGIAQGALDEITAIATAKVPAFTTEALAANPLFRNHLGAADAELRAARALVYGEASAAWSTARDRTEFTLVQRARLRAATTWAVRAAAEVVDVAYTEGGGSSIRDDNPLQRRLRDVHALTQHFAIKPDTFTLAGAVIAGQAVDTTFL